MSGGEEVPFKAYIIASDILNKFPIEKPWIAIHETEDGTVKVTDSDGNSCAFCDWDQSKPLGDKKQ